MSDDYKSCNMYFGDISKLINWILDSGATFHMTPQISDFIPGSLENIVSLVKLFGAVAVIISIKTHLKGEFDFNIFLDLAFLFIEEI